MMNISKGWVPTICLVVSLVLSATALFMPWWSIRTSDKLQMTGNTTKAADYMPFQTVVAVDTGANKSIVVPFSELDANQTDTGNLASLFSNTVIVTGVGMALTVVALALTVFSIIRKPFFNQMWIIAALGGILLFVAPLFLASEVPTILAEFNSVIPSSISVVPGSQITGLWGSSQSWIWGAGFGWFLLFTGSLICLIGSVLTRVTLRKTD